MRQRALRAKDQNISNVKPDYGILEFKFYTIPV